jgi:hypothetical protein
MASKSEVVDLATYRAQRAVRRAHEPDGRLVAVHAAAARGPSLDLVSHRRRMLRHLATLAMSGPKAASEL